MTRILTEDQLRQAVGYDRAAFDQVEQAYLWMRDRKISMPPVFHIDIDQQSAIDVKGAYVEDLPAFAIKMASGFYENPKQGLASSSSVILLISSQTGFCEAVFLDNGYLMNLRTALAGAVATDHLARKDASVLGIVGTGVQAREQLAALVVKRNVKNVFVWGRHDANAEACADDLREITEADVRVVSDLEHLVRQSEMITTTTQSTHPLIQADWVQPGTHITAMGSDLPGKQELGAAVLTSADLIVCDSVSQCQIGGELQHVSQDLLKRPVVELSSVIAGDVGRRSDTDITVCDQTGLGVLDTAIALAAFEMVQGT